MMKGAFKVIAGCFKGQSSSYLPNESCKGNEKKKKEEGAKSKKAPVPTSYFPLGSNLSRL